MEEILLGNKKFKAIEVVDLTESLAVPEHRTEEGFKVADHVFFEPAEIQLTLTVDANEINTLKSLFESKEVATLTCSLGVYENVVVRELSAMQGGAANVYRAVVRVKQIRKAKAKFTTVPLPITPDEEEAKGGESAVSPPQKEVPQAPEKQENKSWLDSIFEFFGGLFRR